MPKNNNETSIEVKRVNSRYIMIRENIHEALDNSSLILYQAFRYEADYAQEDATIKRSAKFMYEKARLSRAQFYRCLNKLENHGLIKRDEKNSLGSTCVYHVAQELDYFNTDCRGVSSRDRGVSSRDTDHYSFPLINTNSEFQNSPVVASEPKKPNKPSALLWELVAVYRKVFPDNPQPHKRVISTSLQRTLATLVKRWPELDPEGKVLTVDAFERYLSLLKTTAPKFSLGEYVTDQGNRKKNNLETFARWNTVVKFLENAYS